MGTQTPAEYEKRIAQLEAELAEMRERVKLSVRTSEGPTDSRPGLMSTIAGVEEMLLHVSSDGEIRYLNGPMAKLLGLPDRNVVLGKQLASLPSTNLLEGTLPTVFESAQRLGQPVEVEREFE